MISEHPFGTQVEGKKNAVFSALTVHAQIYKNYDDPGMSPEMRDAYYPLVLMVHRWDGRLGFPGGFMDEADGGSFLVCGKRELKEEVGAELVADELFVPVCTHELERLLVHFYHCDLGRVSTDVLERIMVAAARAFHGCAEGNAVWTHLADYGRGKGIETTLKSNILASAVKEELEILVNRLRGK